MPDVVIVGAGVAGLAAAATLRTLGRDVLVLEAGWRAGGRAHTVMPGKLGGVPVDLGASWFHKASENPLARIAHDAGVKTTPFAPQTRLSAGPGAHFANPGERAAADDVFAAAFAGIDPLPDRAALGILLESGADNPWLPTVANLEGAIISAADLADLSVADWRENELDDDNLWVEGGVGGFVERHLAPLAGAIAFGWRVDAIDWNAPDGGVTVSGERGSVHAAGCIVTVSTGVLGAGKIRFVTPLPAGHAQALADLPMGLLSRIIFPAAAPELRALDADTTLDHLVRAYGDPAMVFMARPAGADIVVGHAGGRAAWALSREGPAGLEAFARDELAAIFGGRARDWLPEGAGIASGWGEDTLFLGAYSYGRPGCGDARDALAQPVGGGRLFIAGEACHRGMAGTVQAAWMTGNRAARLLDAQRLPRQAARP